MSIRPSSLPLFHRTVLRSVEYIVPRDERDDFIRSWHAELWHMNHCVPRKRLGTFRRQIDMPLGVTSDAIWLRTHSIRRSLAGTPMLCILSLLSLSLVSFVLAIVSYGGWHELRHHLGAQATHCLISIPIILFVSWAIANFSHVEISSLPHTLRWINHLVFAALKTSLALLLMFLMSVCLARPLYIPLPRAADLLQIFFFVFLALLAVRWSFHDQEQRCKRCLCSLATPARVGRPSHNLLEWNGTEQICKQGHGRLSVPEIETSWHQYSRWIDQASSFDHLSHA